VSPRKIICSDELWNKYEQKVIDDRGATELRYDTTFLDRLLQLLQSNISEILKSKEKKAVLQCGLKVLCLVITKGKADEENNTKLDIIKNVIIPSLLLNMLKAVLKLDYGRNHVDLISDLIKTSGLLSKATFDKTLGIDSLFLKSFFPILPNLIKAGAMINDIPHLTLLINIVKYLNICKLIDNLL